MTRLCSYYFIWSWTSQNKLGWSYVWLWTMFHHESVSVIRKDSSSAKYNSSRFSESTKKIPFHTDSLRECLIRVIIFNYWTNQLNEDWIASDNFHTLSYPCSFLDFFSLKTSGRHMYRCKKSVHKSILVADGLSTKKKNHPFLFIDRVTTLVIIFVSLSVSCYWIMRNR